MKITARNTEMIGSKEIHIKQKSGFWKDDMFTVGFTKSDKYLEIYTMH